MVKTNYEAQIKKPTVHTTSKGVRFVRPFDIIRSEQGRAVITRLSKAGSFTVNKSSPPVSNKNKSGRSR